MLKQIANKLQYAALVAPAFAQDQINIKPPGEFANLGNITVPGIISTAITLLVIVVALIFFFMLVLGGLKWVTSGGDEKNVAAARSQITNALIGLAIVFAAWAIMQLVGTIFQVDIFNFKIPTISS